MSKIDEMIKELCPDGVEYVRLGKVIEVVRGKRLTKNQLSECKSVEYNVPVIHGGDTPMGYYTEPNRKAGTTLVINTGTAGNVYYYDEPYWSSDACFSLYPRDNIILDKYLYYCVSSKEDILHSKIRSGAMPTIDSLAIENLTIPLPPIEIQREIVKVLDNFTEYSTELQTELQARLKQYEYYRDKLLSFENIAGEGGQVEWFTLGEICDVLAGGDVPKDAFSNEKTHKYHIPIISNGIGENAMYGYTCDAKITKCAVTVSARGTIGYAEYRDYPYYPIVRLLSVIPNDTEKLSVKYLYYCLQGRDYKLPACGIPQLTAPDLKKQKIPVPPLGIQNRIVYVLDNFDAVCNDLKIGLPAEIEARQKQYEYYRDRLLSFDDAANSGIERERERERGLIRLRQYVFGYAKVKLSLVSRYSQSRIDFRDLNLDTYVGVDNLLQNKAGKIRSEHVPQNGNWTKYHPGDILIGNIRPYLRKIWFADNTGGASGDVLVIEKNFDCLDARFLYHVLSSEKFFNYNNGKSKGAKMPRGSKSAIMNFEFILPNLKEQQRIISTLDSFGQLTTDISIGLPAEITARQKQYECYRNKLLTLPEKISNSQSLLI